MKKFLLSLAAIAMAASMSATSYTVFDIANPGSWTGDANGYTQTITVGGKSFTLTSNKAASTTNLISPDANSYAWRVYKSSEVTISSADVDMKQIVIGFEGEVNGTKYYAECDLSAGWTGTLVDQTYTLTSAGLKTVTLTASNIQVRIKTIVVSDEQGEVEPPVTPELPDGVIYENAFNTDLEGWTLTHDEALAASDWYINKSIGCAVANSYKDGANQAAQCSMTKEFDCAAYKNVKMSVNQAFGFDFPTAQVSNYVASVREAGTNDWYDLTFYAFGTKGSGNWSSWEVNEFDLSEYDGQKIEIKFTYTTDGTVSRAWELKEFKLTGDKSGSVGTIEVEDATAVYYNLQGVRVANPEKGMYIMVKGNKSMKVAK